MTRDSSEPDYRARKLKPRSRALPSLEALEDMYALRIHADIDGPTRGQPDQEIEAELQQRQKKDEIEIVGQSHDVIMFRFTDRAARERLLPQMEQWLKAGKVDFVTPVLRDLESGHRQILTDEITVRFDAELSPEESKKIAQQYDLKFAYQNEFVPNQYIVRVSAPFGLHTLEVAQALTDVDNVKFATPNYISEHSR